MLHLLFPKIFLEADKQTGDPILPDALLPPEKIRHVFAQVSNFVPHMNSIIESAEYDDGAEDDVDPVQESIENAAIKRRAAKKDPASPKHARGKHSGPKNILKDSFRQSEQNRSLEFDTLMSGSCNQRTANILFDTFGFLSFHEERTTSTHAQSRPHRLLFENHSANCEAIAENTDTRPVESALPYSHDVDEQAGVLGSALGRLKEEAVPPCDLSSVSC